MTDDRHGFLYVDLMQSDKTKMFYKDLNKQIVVNQNWIDKHALCLQYLNRWKTEHQHKQQQETNSQ